MKLTDTPSDRTLLPNLVKSFQEWATGRHNISVADCAIESAWQIAEAADNPLTLANGLEIAERINDASAHMSKAAQLMIGWVESQRALGGALTFEPEATFKTFGGEINLSELSRSVAESSGFLTNLAGRLERFKDLDPDRPLAEDSTALGNIPGIQRQIGEALELTLRVIEIVDPGHKRLSEYIDLIETHGG